MKIKGINALLLFAFSIPVVMNYRIFPMEGTPYLLFGLLFISLIVYSLVSMYAEHYTKLRLFLLSLIISISVGGASITAIADRHAIAPVWGVHDIILQQEAAIRYLVQGKNPYKETYFGTPVEMFRYDEQGKAAINPALYHFVMPPGYLLLPLPFYWLSNRLFGYFDGRMMLIVLMVATLFFLYRWFKNKDFAELAIIVVSLSPASTDYLIEGRSDLFALAFLIFSLVFLKKKTISVSLLFFALSMLVKQTMWFAFPLYLAYIYVLKDRSLRKVMPAIFFMSLIGMIFVAPFLWWDSRAFLDSVILYLSQGGERGYPVSGYGLSMILHSFGVINGLKDYYPFLLWQLAVGVPAVILTLKYFLKQPSFSRFFIGFALTLFSFWYTSRYFNNSHIAVIAGLFAFGILHKYDEGALKSS